VWTRFRPPRLNCASLRSCRTCVPPARWTRWRELWSMSAGRQYTGTRFVTRVKSYLARGRITFLSPLAAANAFVCCMRWADTLTRIQWGSEKRVVAPEWNSVAQPTSTIRMYFVNINIKEHEWEWNVNNALHHGQLITALAPLWLVLFTSLSPDSSIMFLGCPSTAFAFVILSVLLFFWTDVVTTISHEWLEQSRWNL